MSTTSEECVPSRGWHPEQIKAAIRMRGVTMVALSRQHGLTEKAVGLTLTRPWPTVERIIAEFLGIDAGVIWPERYTSEGKPVRGGGTLEARRAINQRKSRRRTRRAA